ncbi:MAG: SAM-dependent methyltransferase [Hylemonella sp.]|nr:SAM-dependent methyltransferase [Hylemonella sp.]MDP1937228.1 SAM-dependent methyltransferase [Hylemonella sp.]
MTTPDSLTTALTSRIVHAIQAAGGWLGFDDFMAQALYTPGLGYYANDLRKLGLMPGSGSDFVTAPELSPLFGRALAAQVGQALQQTQTHEVWEFGAGSGALALQLLDTLGEQVTRYTIVDLSGALRARQQQTLQKFGDKVRWASELPAAMQGVVVGNEVLDAMPVKLLARLGGVWHERGVAVDAATQAFVWQDRATALRPPLEVEGAHDYVTEIHPQAEAFVRTLADKLQQGAAFFLDYGFPEREYYHPQRHMGTVMCHRAHQADADPLCDVGLKDITAHVNFTGVALAAQEAGLEVLGYSSQARFLLNCGLAQLMEQSDLAARAQASKLIMEHEMGELFKVIGLTAGEPWAALGFSAGDRTHTL